MPYNVEIKDLPARPAAVVQFTAHVSEMGEHLGRAFGATMQRIEQEGAGIAGPPFAYFVQLGDERFDVSAGFPVEKPITAAGDVKPFELPGGRIATTVHVGSYQQLSDAYAALEAAAKEQGGLIDPKSPSWEEYLSGPETPPEQTQTVVYWPLKQQ